MTALKSENPIQPAPDALATFRAPPGAAAVGLGLFLSGMSIGFAFLFVAFLAVRARVATEHLVVPPWFWVSTFVVLASSVIVQYACVLSRAGRALGARRALWATLGLGMLFLVLQTLGFVAIFTRAAADAATTRLYYVIALMAALHGAHLVGGLGRLAVLARKRGPAWAEPRHVLQLTVYWHYLAVLWMAMFGLFVLSRGAAA